MTFRRIDDLGSLSGLTAVVRVDLNLPMDDKGNVTDKTRIRAIKPTIENIIGQGGRVVLLAHFGRPKGKVVEAMSLRQIVPAVSACLGRTVVFCDWNANQNDSLPYDADVVLMENTRFFKGEEQNDPELAVRFAALGDVYINDAFSCAHRAHASTAAIAGLLPSAAGESMAGELAALEKALGNPEHPVIAVVGGAKVSTKLDLLQNLVRKVDHLIIGGGMANTFLFADGHAVGASLCEKELVSTAHDIVAAAREAGCVLHLPCDLVVAKEFKAGAPHRIIGLGDVGDDEMILDAGPKTVATLKQVLQNAKTLVWNGPMGAFELTPFDRATVELARTAALLTKSDKLLTVAGGGDTVAALAHAGVKEDFSHISTAGGAFLEWMEGKVLPGVKALD